MTLSGSHAVVGTDQNEQKRRRERVYADSIHSVLWVGGWGGHGGSPTGWKMRVVKDVVVCDLVNQSLGTRWGCLTTSGVSFQLVMGPCLGGGGGYIDVVQLTLTSQQETHIPRNCVHSLSSKLLMANVLHIRWWQRWQKAAQLSPLSCNIQGTVAASPPFGGAQIDLQPSRPRVAIFSSSYASRCIWL